jgi:hypothetical protein
MILQSAELSPSQKAAIEEKVGRKLLDAENIVLCGGNPKVANSADRQNAVLQMRQQLSLLDRSQRRMSIEEWTAALLGETGNKLPV